MTEIRWRRKVLTPEEIAQMIEDYNKGMKIREIMEKYAISKQTLYSHLKKESNK